MDTNTSNPKPTSGIILLACPDAGVILHHGQIINIPVIGRVIRRVNTQTLFHRPFKAVLPHHLVPRKGWRPPCQGWGACPREIERKPSLRCTPRWSSTSLTTRPSPGPAAEVAQTLPSPSPSFGGNGPSHQTTDPQSQQPKPPDGLVHTLPPTPGMWSLSCAALPPKPRRRLAPIPPERRHQRGVDCQLGSSAITSILRPSRPLKAPTSRSRTKALGSP